MRRFIGILLILMSLSLSSCIDILDELIINQNKSGSVFIGFESQVLGSVMNMAKEQIDPAIISELDSFPRASAERLNGIPGIHEIDAMDVISRGRFGIAFNFDNPKALNRAYYALLDMDKKWYYPRFVKIGKHKISRKNITPQLVKQIDKENPDLRHSKFLRYLNIKSVIKLPAENISIESENKAQCPSPEEVVIRYSFKELLNEEQSTAYKIRF